MRQIVTIASARVPWLLPAVGLAMFVHKHFLCFNGHSAADARARASTRRPPKLKRSASKKIVAGSAESSHVEDPAAEQQDQLAAAGLAHDRLMEWFTEDEVEALHQAQANPAALLSLLCQSHVMAADEGNSDWYTDEGEEGQGYYLDSPTFKPLELLQDPSAAAAIIDPVEQLQQLQQTAGEEQWEQQLQVQLAQHLLLEISKARQQHAAAQQQQQQQQGQPYVHAAGATTQADDSIPAAAGTAAAAEAQDDDDYDDDADYFDPNAYFGLSPAGAAGMDIKSPGQFLPRAGALWASSYPPHFDIDPEWEPDFDEPDFEFDYQPDFDPGFGPGFDDDDLGFDDEGFASGFKGYETAGFESSAVMMQASSSNCGPAGMAAPALPSPA